MKRRQTLWGHSVYKVCHPSLPILSPYWHLAFLKKIHSENKDAEVNSKSATKTR